MFRHEAMLYAGDDGFLDGALPFLRDGLKADEAMLVVVSSARIGRLREALGPDAGGVRFADMDRVGSNPARIIPAWQRFVSRYGGEGRPIRGIGEPVHPGRSAPALVECHRHESLLNLAFDRTPGFRLLCPYDTGALEPAVIEEARCTHPFVREDGIGSDSGGYGGLEAACAPFGDPLPEPRSETVELAFASPNMHQLRALVATYADLSGFGEGRTDDLVLAISELAANSILHGGGEGSVRIWREPGVLICEVRDAGRIDEPLVGRRQPVVGQIGGYGVWLVNQLCELVQVRTLPTGNVVRVHMAD